MVCSRSLLNMVRWPPETWPLVTDPRDGGSTDHFQPCKPSPTQNLQLQCTVYAFSMVHSKGCWLTRAYSLTCATLDSATSRVNTPHTPRPRVCTCSITWVAFSRFMAKNRIRTSTTKSIGV